MLLIIAIVIVVALVIGPAVIGAVGAAAASLGAGAAAGAIGTVIGGAIVGAATSATIAVVSNVVDGRTWHQGVGKAAIMGAIGGAFGAGAGALIGKYVATTGFQLVANVAADAVLEVGTTLVTGEFSWEALGMAVLMSAVMGGFGEDLPSGASSSATCTGRVRVPGARGRAYAETLRPPGRVSSDAEQPMAPRGETEVEGGRPGDVPSARPADESAGHRAPAAEVETRTRVGDTEHDLKVINKPDGAEVWVCSNVCGPLKSRVDDILPHVQDPKVRAQLEELKVEADRLEARVNDGEIPQEAARLAAVRKLGDRLQAVGESSPQVGQLLEGDPDFSRLEIEVGEPASVEQALALPPGTKVLYIVREPGGRILKVG